jgi:hypothetical protein
MAVTDRGGTGWSGTSDSVDAAKASALAFCRQVGQNCVVVSSGEGPCFAVAGDTRQYHGGYGATKNDAEQDAVRKNGGGIVLASYCLWSPVCETTRRSAGEPPPLSPRIGECFADSAAGRSPQWAVRSSTGEMSPQVLIAAAKQIALPISPEIT